MIKKLTRTITPLHYFKEGRRIDEPNPNMSGDCSDVYGNCTGLRGDCSGLWNNCSGLSGDCTGVEGNLDACEITDEERKNGININDLIGE